MFNFNLQNQYFHVAPWHCEIFCLKKVSLRLTKKGKMSFFDVRNQELNKDEKNDLNKRLKIFLQRFIFERNECVCANFEPFRP